MTLTAFIDSEHAVSEVVDFGIILGIMVLAVAVIGVAGFPLVEHMQEAGHTENIRQSFAVLAANLNKVAFGSAPSQSIELKMYGGTISATGSSTINVTVETWNSSTSSVEPQSFERQMRMIENEFKDRSICYENTGAWAQYLLGDAVMVSKPHFAFYDDVLVVPAVMISGTSGISGVGLVRVVSDGGESSIYSYQNISQVDITIISKYYKGWERYLNDTLGMQVIDTDDANTTVHVQRSYSPNIDVYITYSPMSIIFE